MGSTQLEHLGTHLADLPTIRAHSLDFYETIMKKYLHDRELSPPGNLAEIRYEDLVRDPLALQQGADRLQAVAELRRPRHVVFRKQRIQRHQQVEVQPSEITHCNTWDIGYSFQLYPANLHPARTQPLEAPP